MSTTDSDRYEPFPARLLQETRVREERGVFVYHEDIGWWELAEIHTDPLRAQERADALADDGEQVVLAKRNVTALPWSLVSMSTVGGLP